MKKILLLLPFLLLISSCSIDWNDDKDKKIKELNNDIVNLNKKAEENTFNKKLECAKLINKEKKWLSDFTSMYYNSAWKNINKEWEMWIEKSRSEVLETFYSKKASSCISVIQISYNMDMSYSYRYIIRDVLENKTIWDYYNWDYYDSLINQYWDWKYDWDDVNYPNACNNNSKINHCIEYYQKLNELKES